MEGVRKLWRMLGALFRAVRRPKLPLDTRDSIGAALARNAAAHGSRPALLCEGETLTWAELNAQANRVAARLAEAGIRHGDCVALMMENRTAFIACLLGIAKLGAVAALINTQQRGRVLAHSLTIVDTRALIVGAECVAAIEEVQPELGGLALEGRQFHVADAALAGGGTALPGWATALDPRDPALPADDRPETAGVTLRDACFYIFTSGTTGLPKAAIFGNSRFFNGGYAFGRICLNVKPHDRIYVCLPLFHATALTTGLASAMLSGCSISLRRKFSATAFFDDIRRDGCTAFVYIGELCRYLMAQPPRPDDARQPATRCVGNGLRPDIWRAFKQRFGIAAIHEFYGASEGNNVFVNAFNKDETIGFSPLPYQLVRYDVEREEIVRGADGLCVPVGRGEPGLLVNEISADAHFEGYTNKAANEAKMVRDVRRKGDVYFNTGDLLREVEVGFAFGQRHTQFVDRLGDTFRWRGENCSTNEIAEVLQRFAGIELANVYGVQVPGTEGRAGMAALNLASGHTAATFDWQGLSAHVRSELASYARPVFLRVQPEATTTSTFKLVKSALKEQAYHPGQTGDDPVYVLLPGEDTYRPMSADDHAAIVGGNTRF
jgi:citronellyl-CoA synthetase